MNTECVKLGAGVHIPQQYSKIDTATQKVGRVIASTVVTWIQQAINPTIMTLKNLVIQRIYKKYDKNILKLSINCIFEHNYT